MTGEREAASELSLKANVMFEFASVYGAADDWVKSGWKRDGNPIILQSDGKARAALRSRGRAKRLTGVEL